MVFQLPEEHIFPDPRLANPDGLIAIGGDLHPERVLKAYQTGIFPWYSREEPILWWSPDPRFVLFPDELKIARSLRPFLNKKSFTLTVNQAFDEVVKNCKSVKRKDQEGTWITEDMYRAYSTLNKQGVAYSVEAWNKDKLVGGLYGLKIGNTFSGESMFAIESNASKYAFVHLVKFLLEQNCSVIDCQIETDYLASFGARLIDREEYLEYLAITDDFKLAENFTRYISKL